MRREGFILPLMELAHNINQKQETANPFDRVVPDWYSFGAFKFYPGTLELLKGNKKISLKVQSAKVLNILLKQKGELVSRDEIIREIWSDRVVEFDLSLNACIRDIRTALEDNANQQKFIETLAKRGYRFSPKVNITEKHNGVRAKHSALKSGALALVVMAGLAAVGYLGIQKQPARTAFQNPATLEQTEASRALVLKGVSAIYDGEVPKPQEAISYFQEALDIDPYYIEAHLMLARTVFSRGRVDQMPLAEASLEKILELNPGNLEALALLGSIKWAVDYNWDGAREDFEKTIAIDPNYNRAYVFLAGYYSVMGDFNQSLGHIDLALSRDTVRLSGNGNVGWFYYLAGRHDEALRFCDETRAINPEGQGTRRCYLNNLMVLGETEPAAGYALAYMKTKGITPEEITQLESAGDHAVLDYFTMFEAGAEVPGNNRVDSTFLFKAIAQTRLGDKSGAIETLNKAYETRNYFLPYIRVIPDLAPLHGEEDFQKLLSSMNFPDTSSLNS